MKEDEKRFWSRFKQEGDCLLWTGYLNSVHKYGQVWFRGKTRWVHRIAWKLRHGGIAEGLWVLHSHSCRNKHCAADNHLRLGTPRENTIDRAIDGRQQGTSFPGERNGRSKLTEAKVRFVRDPKTSTKIFIKLAKEWGVSFGLLYKVRRGDVWKSSKSFRGSSPSKTRTD